MKNWYQFFTAREKFVPIRHIFYANISRFVKFAHVVKLYVAYMRNLHVDKILPKSAAFCIQSQFFTYVSVFYKVVQNFICFTVEKSGTGERLQIKYMSRVARKRFFGVHVPDSPACVHVDTETNTSLLILDRESLDSFQSV